MEDQDELRTGIPLLNAAKHGQESRATDLLAKGCPVNACDDSERTPLHYAAQNGHTSLISILLEQGALLDLPDVYGWTPLTTAVAFNKFEAAQQLLNANAATEGLDAGGECLPEDSVFPESLRWPVTPNFFAAAAGDHEMAQLLLERGAFPLKQNLQGRIPLIIAAGQGHPRTAKLLLEYMGDDTESADLGQTLSTAAEYGHLPVMEAIIDNGFVDDDDKRNYFPPMLSIAGRQGHSLIVHYLLCSEVLQEIGVDLDQCGDKAGKSPLILAVEGNHTCIVRNLLEMGANIEDGWSGETPLIAAVKSGHTDMVRMLLGCSAEVNHPGRSYRTPLHHAVTLGHVDIINLLLAKGGRLTCPTGPVWRAVICPNYRDL